MRSRLAFSIAVIFLLIAVAARGATNTFVVATYNIENWLLMERDGKLDQPKPDAEKQAVADVIAAVRPDVLGLEEMGSTNQLAELTALLHERGVEYPHSAWIQGADETRHVALLSRFPIRERYSRTDYTYSIGTNVVAVQRGFLDVMIEVSPDYRLRAVVTHLKSRLQHSGGFDQARMRLEEAKLLRAHVGKALKKDPALNLIVMGDCNDEPETEPIRILIGEPPFALTDLKPATAAGKFGTHFWRARRQWSRIDYLLASPGMASEFVPGSARISESPASEQASDHRCIFASFIAEDAPLANQPAATAPAPRSGRDVPKLLIIVIVAIAGTLVVLLVIRRSRS